MLGQWLELSVQAPDMLGSLAYYKSLGFHELLIGDTWTHRYAVVSDGALCIGLHDREFDSPALTFVQPDVAHRALAMTDHGFEFSLMKLDADEFNQLHFHDRDGHALWMIEARTFSPPADDASDSVCGTWFELTLPAEDVLRAGRFWAPLAPHLLQLREEPTTHMRFDARGMAVGLSESIALNAPALCFKCRDRERFWSAVKRHGLRAQKYPGFEGAFAKLVAPEGTGLYLFDEDFLGESYVVDETD
ncbi:MAG TPA: hypothetical protein VFE85_09495 [Woeseiaceae bacterium]|nr:hypothetical protein [Woeseiaceae bacterium]